MYQIWGFLLQTISVSIVAVIICLLKKIFEDKLSPRWQYGVWSLLAIRILVPVNLSKYIIPQIALWIEFGKGMVEHTLSSNYSSMYEPITINHVIPVLTQTPQSVTDWMFVIYTIGILCCLLKYLIAYCRLRSHLRNALPASESMEAKLFAVSEYYNLKPCKMVAAEGISSAFICGLLRPKLVIPYAKELDEKILLHELLHLKYHDTLQNIFWCFLRALHWCNPWLQYVMNSIENDMESLCDQRVLELLEGEERRDYGIILLDMANQTYARNPGTSSISNGSKNIAKRIASIVRFKKYPQGMALASICIILILFWPTIIGKAHTFSQDDYKQYQYKEHTLDYSMAIARVNRCETVAGALDMYAKGLYLFNGIYIASASPLSEHERIKNELIEYGCYQSGKYIGNIVELKDYYVFNLDQRSKTKYTGVLCYDVSVQADEELSELLDELNTEEGYYNCEAYIFIPVSITYEDAWVVNEIGERYVISKQDYYDKIDIYTNILCAKEYYGKNEDGEVLLQVETKYKINNAIDNSTMFWSSSLFDTSPKPNALFNYIELNKYIKYTQISDDPPSITLEMRVKEKESSDYFKNDNTDVTIGTHDINGWIILETKTNWESTGGWDGTVEDVAGGGFGEYDTAITDLPSAYSCELTLDGSRKDSFILHEVK